MIFYRPPAPAGKKGKAKARAERYIESARAWTGRATPCGTCNKVRAVAGVVIDAIAPKR